MKSTKTKETNSRLRQKLHAEIDVWLQREKDMEIAVSLGAPGTAEKIVFVRQEREKLEKALKMLDRGFRRQRAWSQGKFLY